MRGFAKWEPVWKLVGLFELIIVLFIFQQIGMDWLRMYQGEKLEFKWVDTFWGQNTEFEEHLRACGPNGAGCPRETSPTYRTGDHRGINQP